MTRTTIKKMPGVKLRGYGSIVTGLLILFSGSAVLAAPIHDAVKEGDKEQVLVLAKTDLDINERNAYETTALQLAARDGNLEIMEILIDNGADVNLGESWLKIAPLHVAARNGNIAMLKLLIENGADMNIENHTGAKPIHYAARAGHSDVVDLLLAKGVDVNSRDAEDYTPLHNSTYNGHMDLTKLLLANGADVNATTYTGSTPLSCAQGAFHEDITALIEKTIAAQ